VQCTGKLQGTHLGGHVNSHDAEIGLLKLGLDRYHAGGRYPIPDTIGHSCTDTDTDTGHDVTNS